LLLVQAMRGVRQELCCVHRCSISGRIDRSRISYRVPALRAA
jgi:hypothetical protein